MHESTHYRVCSLSVAQFTVKIKSHECTMFILVYGSASVMPLPCERRKGKDRVWPNYSMLSVVSLGSIMIHYAYMKAPHIR